MSYQFPRAKGANTSLFLKSKNVNAVQDIVEAINNLEVVVQQADSAGNIIARVEGKVNLTPRGLTILIPTSLQPSGSGTPVAGSSFQLFTVISDGGDFMVCYQNSSNSDVNFTPASSGQQVNVYKSWKLRTSLATETINGTVFAYTYVPNGNPVSYYTRNWTGSDGSSGSDIVIPFYLPNDPVWAEQDADGNWIDVNRDGRAWATQQPPT